MPAPEICATTLAGDPGAPRLVVGPSLGTSAQALWSTCAGLLGDRFHVVGWDLPGHGASPATDERFSVPEVAEAVVDLLGPGPFAYAGDSFGGAVGLQVLLDHPGVISHATLLCTGARIGETDGWYERAALVRRSGTAAVLDRARSTWFAPGFEERRPDARQALLAALEAADDDSYARACEALAQFDVRDRLGEVAAPVLAVAGDADTVTPTAGLAEVAEGVQDGRLVVLVGVAHLAPAEAPYEVARVLRRGPGERVRRAVLGDAYVDRAEASASDLTRDFQDLLTEYAWGRVWSRPGLDRRSRSLVTVAALVAGGHHDELAAHVRGALANGVTVEELREALLQTAVYCGVPAANAAYRVAEQVLAEG